MTEEYYHIMTDMWRLFRSFLMDPEPFTDDWWKRWAYEADRMYEEHHHRLTADLLCAFTTELEWIRDSKGKEHE